jgi:ACS family hexuronate transporter-like MFS transporter
MENSAAPKRRTGNLRWWICTLLFLATMVNYLDRQTLSVAIPRIVEEFGLNNQDVAAINNAFNVAYMVGQLLTGKLVDVVGTRMGFLLVMVVWSAAGMMCASARGAFSLGMFRFILGFGEAGNWPVSVKAVSEWFPAKQRGLAVAYFSSASGLGAMMAPFLIAQLILWSDWRWAFVIIGLSGFLWVPLWLWLYRSPREHWLISPEELQLIEKGQAAEAASAAKTTERRGMLAEWAGLLRYRQVWGVFLVRFFSDSILWFYIQWLPKYFADERGYSMEDIRDNLPWVFLPAIFTALFGGAASGWLIGKGWDVGKARKTVMLVFGLMMTSSFGVGVVESDVTALVLSTIALLAFYGYSVNTLTLPSDLFPPRLVASVSGLSGMGAGLGSVLFTYVVGILADQQSFTPVFFLVGCLPLCSLAMLFFVMGRVKRIVA